MAKQGMKKAKSIIAGTTAPSQKEYHTVPHAKEKPVSAAYSVIDGDMARDNLENDLPAADLQDL